MVWVKLDDRVLSHPKIRGLPARAKVLFIAGLTYAAGELTDGRLAPAALGLVLALAEARRADIGLLVARGLWEPEGGGYRIHDFLDYQSSAAQVRADRRAAAARMARLRASGAFARTNGVTSGRSSVSPYPEYPETGDQDLPAGREAGDREGERTAEVRPNTGRRGRGAKARPAKAEGPPAAQERRGDDDDYAAGWCARHQHSFTPGTGCWKCARDRNLPDLPQRGPAGA